MTKKELHSRYQKTPVNPKFYGTINLDTINPIKDNVNLAQGYVWAPYIPIITKSILVDENRTYETWQISRWMRLKLWFYGLIGKLKKIG